MRVKMPCVTTKRLYIRPLELEDASDLFEIYADPEVMLGNAEMKPIESIDGVLHFLQRGFLFDENTQLPQAMVLERLSDGLVIGLMAYYTLKERVGELGYLLAKTAWHQGYMQEALQVLIALGFTHLNLHRIEARYDPSNIASERLLEHCGFVKEGFLRKAMLCNDDIYHDLMVCSILASEYQMHPVWESIERI